jgi:hypothetical protein
MPMRLAKSVYGKINSPSRHLDLLVGASHRYIFVSVASVPSDISIRIENVRNLCC